MVAIAVLSRNVRRAMNIWFFGLAVSCAGWVIGIAGFLLSNDHALALRWAQFYYVAPLLIGASSVAFALAFPSGGSTRRPIVFAVFAGFFVLSGLIIFDQHFMLDGVLQHSWGKEVVLKGVPYAIYGAFLIATFYLTLKPIYLKSRTERGIYRSQSTVFFEGYLISCVLGVLFNYILPALGNYQLIWVGPLATMFYLFATAYGIIKHRLFDVQIVAARAVGYVLSILALASLYGVLAFGVISLALSGQVDSTGERMVSAALAVLLAITFRPIRRFFDRMTNRLFYRDAYDTQGYMDRLNHVLVSSVGVDNLLANAAQVIESTLKTERCSFIIREKMRRPLVVSGNHREIDRKLFNALQETMAKATAKVAVTDFLDPKDKTTRHFQAKGVALIGVIGTERANNESGLLGYLVLGPKKSGYPYSKQDRRTMELTVNELTIAVQNALRFQEIANFNATLQQKVDEATRKLRRTNDKLRALDETKDDFISMASHQLRTPLTSVKGYVSMVLDGDAGKITPLQRRLLNQSFISSQRMVYLISDLLNVSRLRTGKFVIEPLPCNLAAIIKEEVDQLVETAKGRNLTLVYQKPERFPTLLLDETKMRQVIMNFIDNAIYYTPAGGHITVNLVEKGNSIEFTVVDNGIGVPKSEQHHLFSKFYRAPNAKRARPDGTGLGLFMAKKVIIAQGGAVIFKSQEGRGSTFGFTFSKDKVLVPDQQS